MNIKTDSKTTMEVIGHFHHGQFKTHPCDLGDWWGEDICKSIRIGDEIKKIPILEGEYKITITLEKI